MLLPAEVLQTFATREPCGRFDLLVPCARRGDAGLAFTLLPRRPVPTCSRSLDRVSKAKETSEPARVEIQTNDTRMFRRDRHGDGDARDTRASCVRHSSNARQPLALLAAETEFERYLPACGAWGAGPGPAGSRGTIRL